jgi:hypothetical protein
MSMGKNQILIAMAVHVEAAYWCSSHPDFAGWIEERNAEATKQIDHPCHCGRPMHLTAVGEEFPGRGRWSCPVGHAGGYDDLPQTITDC